MKIGLFILVVFLALLRPVYPFAQEVIGVQDFGKIQQETSSVNVYSQAVYVYCNDSLFDINDDDLNDTERRNLTFQRSIYKTMFFVPFQTFRDLFNKVGYLDYSFHFQASLIILLRVFRL